MFYHCIAQLKLFTKIPPPQLSDLISKIAESFWDTCNDVIQISVVYVQSFSFSDKVCLKFVLNALLLTTFFLFFFFQLMTTQTAEWFFGHSLKLLY